MRSFTDITGREWQLAITVGAVKRVREATGVLLTSLFGEKCQLMAELLKDVIKLVDVLWVLCEKQAVEAGVTLEIFAESLGGDSLGKASEALVRATADFFTSPEQRASLHKLIDLMNEATQEFTAGASRMVDNLDASQLGRSCLDFVLSGQELPAANLNHAPQGSCS